MSIVLLNQKKAELIEKERTYINTLELRLFSNNITPVAGDTEASFTEPTGDGGYGPKSITMAAATLNGANQGELLGTTQTWTFDHAFGDFTIYGVWWRDPSDGKAVLAEKITPPFAVSAPGQTYTCTPRKVMDSL